MMSSDEHPREIREGEIIPRNPRMREADPRDLEAAADELRSRTMTLEPDDPLPFKGLVATIMAVVVALVVALIAFRGPLKALLGLT